MLVLTFLTTDNVYETPIVLTWIAVNYAALLLICRPERSPADLTTIARVILSAAAFAWPNAGLVVLALFVLAAMTDALDGWLARRRNPTEYGAILDMEADQLLILCLAAVLSTTSVLGYLLLLLPALKYFFVPLQAVLRVKYADPKPIDGNNTRAKTIYVVALIGLLINLTPNIRQPFGDIILALATFLITTSFLLDFSWLLRAKTRRSKP